MDTVSASPAATVPAPRTAPDTARVTPVPAARAPSSRPPARPRPRLGLPEIAVAAVAYVGLLLVGHAVTDAAGITAGPWLAVVSAAAALGAVVAALAVRVRSLAPLRLRTPRPAMLLVGVAVGLATWLLARGLLALWTDLGGTLPAAQPGLWAFTGTGTTVAMVVLVGLVVPCVEELLFRGVLVPALGRYGLVVAALGSAVLFAAAHGLAFVVVAAVVLGTVNAVMVWRWRSIWPCVAAHAAFNLVSVGLTLTAV